MEIYVNLDDDDPSPKEVAGGEGGRGGALDVIEKVAAAARLVRLNEDCISQATDGPLLVRVVHEVRDRPPMICWIALLEFILELRLHLGSG